nr:LCP family protein [Streptomyces albidochromogenes]
MDADVTDSSGTPSGPDTPAEEDEATGRATEGAGEPATKADGEGPAEEAGSDADRDANGSRRWMRWTALGASFALLLAAGVGWWLYRKLDGNITTDTTAAAELEEYEKERPTPIALDARNILLIGSDTRSGRGNDKYGPDKGTQRSDTTILLHLAGDRKSATAVSLPRDLMVDIPSCRKPDGSRTRKQFTQFNSAFESGGTACTIRTVEKLTGVRVDHHMVVDFAGFKGMVDAVDGVEICLKEPIDDDDALLRLDKGRQKLNGEQALGFVRARKTIGDGSDTERMERQQRFLGALVNKVQSNGVLLNPTRLYPVLDAATKSLTTDSGLDSLKDLYNLVRGMRNIPTERVQFMTVPRQPYAQDPNRDELVEPDAGRLFKQLREDAPVSVVPAGSEEPDKDGGPGADEKPDDAGATSPAPAPTFTGSNAATDECE